MKYTPLLIVILLILGIAWITWTNHRGQRAVEQAIREIAQSGITLERPAEVAPENNGSRYLFAAAEVLYQPEDYPEDLPIIGGADWPHFGQAIEPDQIRTLEQMTATNQHMYELIESARAFENFNYPFDPYADMQASLDILGDSRALARWIHIRQLLYSSNGDHDAAVGSVADIFMMAELLRNKINTISALVEISLVAMGYSAAEELLSRHVLSTQQTDRLQQIVMSAIDKRSLLRTMRLEMYRDLVLLKDPDRTINRAHYNAMLLEDVWEEVEKTIIEAISEEPFEQEEFWWIRQTERVVMAYTRVCPGSVQLATIDEFRKFQTAAKMVDQTGKVDEDFADFANDQGYYTPNALAAGLRTERQVSVLLLCHFYGLEAEKYRLSHGRWPERIEEIAREDIPPTDPWGNPLAIRTAKFGLIVYSFGSDGEDDFGFNRWDPPDRERFGGEEPDDWRMLLLDPKHRGQLTEADREQMLEN